MRCPAARTRLSLVSLLRTTNSCLEFHSLPPSTESWWSISRAEKLRTTWSKRCAVWSASGRSDIFGTLDPLATGVLVLALGRATRLARFYAGRRKRYTCAVRFGFATDTYDADGEALGPDCRARARRGAIEALAAQFVGKIQQTPPAFSAKKIHGRPAHELARKHKPVNLEPVEVEVFEFRLTGIEGSVARFAVECGSGTYIRSLAHDMGKLHGAGAHLAEIVRTAVGEFTLDHAVPLEELAEDAKAGKFADRVIRLENLLPDLPRATVLPIVEKRVRHGAKFNLAARANSAGADDGGAGRARGTRFRRLEALAAARLQPARAADRHRRACRAAHLPASRSP